MGGCLSPLTKVTHSTIIYSKHCITEYKEGILLNQEGYRKGWQGSDHRVDEEGGKIKFLPAERLGDRVSGLQQGR